MSADNAKTPTEGAGSGEGRKAVSSNNRARTAALQVLLKKSGGRIDIDGLNQPGLSPAERRQAHDLVMGVQRRIFLWDAVLRRYLSKPLKDLAPVAREALRMGVCALVTGDRVPDPVIVSETVALLRKSKPLRGLANAVLRRVAKEKVELPESEWKRDRQHLWVAPGRIVRFESNILPEPKKDLAQHHAIHYALPRDFVAGILQVLPRESENYFRSSVTPLPLTLRPTADLQPEAFEALLRAEGVEVLGWKGPVVEVKTSAEGGVGSLKVLQSGGAVVQDFVAAQVAPFCQAQPGQAVLDLCAPPGGKTLHLAELMRGEGRLVAAFVGAARSERLRENLGRSAFGEWVEVHDLKQSEAPIEPQHFDRVLIDVPCSNSGVLMKRTEARYRLHSEEIDRLRQVQESLLQQAAATVKPGGDLIYSTCSVVPSENHAMVRAFLATPEGGEFALDDEHLRWPQRTGRDGGYTARLRRSQ